MANAPSGSRVAVPTRSPVPASASPARDASPESDGAGGTFAMP